MTWSRSCLKKQKTRPAAAGIRSSLSAWHHETTPLIDAPGRTWFAHHALHAPVIFLRYWRNWRGSLASLYAAESRGAKILRSLAVAGRCPRQLSAVQDYAGRVRQRLHADAGSQSDFYQPIYAPEFHHSRHARPTSLAR